MTTILSCAYLPSVYYFQQIAQAQNILIEQYEHYVKQTYRNRCSIYSANGILNLSIPLKKIDNKEHIKDKQISYSENWQANHWRSIVSAYRSSPYFDFFEGDFHPFYTKKYTFLFDFNMELLELLIHLLRIKPPISLSQQYKPEYEEAKDMRTLIHPATVLPQAFKPYYQVFANKHGFIPNLSIIDLLFNEGKFAKEWL